MTRQSLVSIVATLVLIPCAVKAEEPTPKNAAQPEFNLNQVFNFNQVYVKLIMPTAPTDRWDRPVVESWIAEDLAKRGQAKFTAVTAWVPLDPGPFEATHVWDGGRLSEVLHCPVGADIPERAKGRIEVHLVGWHPGGAFLTVSLRDEPGSRVIAAVEEMKTARGMPYVAVLIGPPPEKPAAATERER